MSHFLKFNLFRPFLDTQAGCSKVVDDGTSSLDPRALEYTITFLFIRNICLSLIPGPWKIRYNHMYIF